MSLHKTLILLPFLTAIAIAGCGEKPESTANSNKTVEKPTPSSETVKPQPKTKPKVDRGASLYKRCRTCHTLNKGGANKVGPNLFGIFGAIAGANEDFRYSKVMKESGITWTDENLAAYIKSPAKFMPGNTMSFAGIRKDEDVAALLEYMRTQTSE